MKRIFIIIGIIGFIFSCTKEEIPTCKIINPINRDKIIRDSSIVITVEAHDKDGSVHEVSCFINDEYLQPSKTPPYSFNWSTVNLEYGEYIIKAIAKDDNGNTTADEITVEVVGKGPVASFATINTQFAKGDTIEFIDQSINSPAKWEWDFGDGSSSTEQYPIHSYKKQGLYTISLTVSNKFGKDTKTFEDYLTVNTREIVYGTITDIDDNIYKTVEIGAQVWIAENLKVTHFGNGTEIRIITDNEEWEELEDNNTEFAMCYYNNNENGEKDEFGALYTFAAAKYACPEGWRLPNKKDWETLKGFVENDGHDNSSAIALKATTHWKNNSTSIDEYGFAALPSGSRNCFSGEFIGLGIYCRWWCNNDNYAFANRWLMEYDSKYLMRSDGSVFGEEYYKSSGFSVRCIKNQ